MNVEQAKNLFDHTMKEKMTLLSEADQCIFYSTCLSFLDAMLFDRGICQYTADAISGHRDTETVEPKKIKAEKTAKAEKTVKTEKKVSEKVAEVVEEAIEATTSPAAIPMPKEDETKEEVENRRSAFCTVYGNKTLKEIFENEELSAYLAPEFSQIQGYTEIVFDHYKDLYENFSKEDASSVVYSQIASADDSVEDFSELTADKFLNIFHPYMVQMYYILQFSEEDIVDAMKAMSNGTLGANGGSTEIDYTNAGAVMAILNEKFPEN